LEDGQIALEGPAGGLAAGSSLKRIEPKLQGDAGGPEAPAPETPAHLFGDLSQDCLGRVQAGEALLEGDLVAQGFLLSRLRADRPIVLAPGESIPLAAPLAEESDQLFLRGGLQVADGPEPQTLQ